MWFSKLSCMLKYGLEESGKLGICGFEGINRCGWGLTRSLFEVCNKLGEDDDVGGEPEGARGLVTGGIKRSGGGSKCWRSPEEGMTDEFGKKLPWKESEIPTEGIPLDTPGNKGELDPEEDDFLTSPWRLPRLILEFVDDTNDGI